MLFKLERRALDALLQLGEGALLAASSSQPFWVGRSNAIESPRCPWLKFSRKR